MAHLLLVINIFTFVFRLREQVAGEKLLVLVTAFSAHVFGRLFQVALLRMNRNMFPRHSPFRHCEHN